MPVGVQCTSLPHKVSFPAIGIGSGVLGFRPYWCPSPFPSLSILGVFQKFALICHWISIVFLLYGRCIATHSVDPSLTHFLGEFPGLGLALVPDVVVPEAEQRCAWSRKLNPSFCPGRGRTSDLGIQRPRMLPLDYRAPLLLVASYDMQEPTAGQF